MREGNKAMKSEIAGITRANEGMQGISWNILARLCAEELHRAFLLLARDAAARHLRAAAYPSGSGRVSLHPGRQARFHARRRRGQATPGDLVRLAMGIPHGIFNKSDQTAKVLFWVSPSRKLYDLFWDFTT